MRDVDRYFRLRHKRRRGLDKTAEHAQVLYVRSDFGFAVERRYVDSSNEWESSRAMDLNRDGHTSIFLLPTDVTSMIADWREVNLPEVRCPMRKL